MFDKEAYHKEYREKRKEDPEKLSKYNNYLNEWMRVKYAEDEAYREEIKRKRRERYERNREVELARKRAYNARKKAERLAAKEQEKVAASVNA